MAMERIYVTEPRMILKAGHQGENLARCICFPLTNLAEQYGEGTWTIVFRRPFESDPYVVANQEEVGEYAVWGLDATDTAVCGEGRVELRYYVDDVLCKTDVYAVSLLPSLGTTGDAPSPYEDIIDAVAGYAAEARDAVASVPETVAELQAELNEAISGATVDSEVINARVDSEGTTYSTLKARLDAENTDLKNEITNVRTDIGAPFVTFESVSGKYIYNNAEKSGNAFSRSNPIAVSKGDIVEFTATGYSNTVAMIAICNAEGTAFTDAVRSTDSTEHTYTYTATANGYIVVSYDHRQPNSLVIKGEYSNTSLDNRLTAFEESGVNYISHDIGLTVVADNVPITIGESGHFINKNGVNSASAAFNMSAVINLNTGDCIIFNSKGYSDNVAVLARYNDDETYTPLINSVDDSESTFKYVALEAMNVVISTSKNVTPVYSIFNSRVDKNDVRITALENDWVAFANMGIIGDSLASGASNYASGAADRPVYSWGKYIEREHGLSVSLFSFGGATTRTWFTDIRGQTALNNGDVLDCYVIGLGVNDAYSLGLSYLGSVSDVHVGSENQNADTYYGNYSKIIATIKSKSPRAKIFCITNPKNTASIADSFNNAIKVISALYTNVYVIDLSDDAFYISKEFTATWYASHSTALGYKLIAKNLYSHISDIIRNNISEFTDIQWIAENHA